MTLNIRRFVKQFFWYLRLLFLHFMCLCFSCDPDFFQSVCSLMSVRSREEAEQLSSLLQLLGSTLQLTGELKRKTCRSVGRALTLCGSDVDLILTPRKISVRGAHLLFRQTAQLRSLKYVFIYFFIITPPCLISGEHLSCHDCFLCFSAFPTTWP